MGGILGFCKLLLLPNNGKYRVEEHPCPEPPKDNQTSLQPVERNCKP